jgi:hypothetical protein
LFAILPIIGHLGYFVAILPLLLLVDGSSTGAGLFAVPAAAYRYLQQAQDLKEPISRGQAKLKFTVNLPRPD